MHPKYIIFVVVISIAFGSCSHSQEQSGSLDFLEGSDTFISENQRLKKIQEESLKEVELSKQEELADSKNLSPTQAGTHQTNKETKCKWKLDKINTLLNAGNNFHDFRYTANEYSIYSKESSAAYSTASCSFENVAKVTTRNSKIRLHNFEDEVIFEIASTAYTTEEAEKWGQHIITLAGHIASFVSCKFDRLVACY